jgi:hypothetical protein
MEYSLRAWTRGRRSGSAFCQMIKRSSYAFLALAWFPDSVSAASQSYGTKRMMGGIYSNLLGESLKD